MKKTLLISAFALLGLVSAKAADSAPGYSKNPGKDAWTIRSCTYTTAENNNKTGQIDHLIDDNVNTWWHNNWNQCNGTTNSHVHWFLLDRGEDAPEFNGIYLEQRHADSMNGAVKHIKVFVGDSDYGLVGTNNSGDNAKITSVLEGTPTLDTDVRVYVDPNATNKTVYKQPQAFSFNNVQSGRYVLVVLTNTVNPGNASNSENSFACLSEFGIFSVHYSEFPDLYTAGMENDLLVRTDRGTTALTVNVDGTDVAVVSPLQNSDALLRFMQYNYVNEFTVEALAGSTVQITPTASGTWMQNYFYIDWAGDGFDSTDKYPTQASFLNADGSLKSGIDLVAFSRSNASGSWKNQDGTAATTNNGGSSMTDALNFVIPEDTPEGTYRVRYKVDWNNFYPEATVTANHNNDMLANGGIIVDFLFHIKNSKPVSLTFKRNADDTNPLVVDAVVGKTVEEFPVYEGFTLQTTGTISENNGAATYVMNRGEEFRIFNKRAYEELNGDFVFINISNNGLRQIASIDDPTSVFVKVPMGEDGGFAIWSDVEQKFVGDIAGTAAAVPMVDFTATPQKYYTGKQSTPNYMDWIGNRPASTASNTDYYFFNDNRNNADKRNGRFVCGYSWNDAGSKWVVVTDMDNFMKNWQLSLELAESAGAYSDALRILGREDEDNLVEWASNYNFGGNVNLPVSDENQEKIHKINEIVAEAAAYYPTYVMNAAKLYTIQSANSRGALIYDAANDWLTTTYVNDNNVGTADAENDNHLWGFVKVGENYYLYNVGAKKFLSAYNIHSHVGNNGRFATYSWNVGGIPTAVSLTSNNLGAEAALHSNQFTIEGGHNNDEYPGGLMIINANENPYRVPCALGVSSRTDGTGFTVAAVRDADAALIEEMTAAVTTGFAGVEAAIDEVGRFEWESDIHGNTIGHYTQEGVDAFVDAIAKAKTVEDPQQAMYAALDAKIAFDGSLRQVVDGHVYKIVSEAGTHYTDGERHLVGEFDNKIVAYSYWVATVNANGVVTFTHNHGLPSEEETPAPAQVAGLLYDGEETSESTENVRSIPFAVGEVNQFKVQTSTDHLGSVKLLNAADNQAVNDGALYNVSFVSSNPKDAVTAIAEITVDGGVKATGIYDLQGRKLAAPAKGINIINGKKVLVK